MAFKNMYPAGTTTITQLAANVAADDSVITVADATVFPPGPNYATIGIDNGFEVIFYAAVDMEAKQLTGCLRGQSGTTAKAWAVYDADGELVKENDRTIYHSLASENFNAIVENLAAVQNGVSNKGLLKGDGKGGVKAAKAGDDYGYPVIKADSDPAPDTPGAVGQRLLNTITGKEFRCTKVEGGTYTWRISGARTSDDIEVGDDSLTAVLDTMQLGIDGAETLTGTADPTPDIVAKVGQQYLNTTNESLWVCVAVVNGRRLWNAAGSGGPSISPQILVAIDDGAEVTATDGERTVVAISENGEAMLKFSGFGTYTVSATLEGETSNEVRVIVDTVKQYNIALSFFVAELEVTAEAGAEVTATDGTHSFTGVAGVDGVCSLDIYFPGEYAVSATLADGVSSTASVNVSEETAYSAEVAFCTITVAIAAGSEITAQRGSTTVRGMTGPDGTAKLYLPSTGRWNVTAALNGETDAGSVDAEAYQGYAIEMSYVKVVGVEWNYANQSTALARLTKENDPNGFVTVNITEEPIAAVGASMGSSPFDSLMPWMGRVEYNVIGGVLAYKKGDANFSRTLYDTVVATPKFWCYIENDTANQKMRFYIADKARAGFSLHGAFDRNDGKGERDYVYPARYKTSSGYESKSGKAPFASITRTAARTGSAAKGADWWQHDYATDCARNLLYLVEYADWNSQAKIGKGFTDASNTAAIATGGTDGMIYHTGRAAGTDGKTSVQYRWEEDVIGNVWEWCDGVNVNANAVYICLDPSKFKDDTTTDYVSAGITLPTASANYIKSYDASTAFPGAIFPTAIGGSESTYVPDCLWTSTGWRALLLGGSWNNAGTVGLFAFAANNLASLVYSGIGSRLLFPPGGGTGGRSPRKLPFSSALRVGVLPRGARRFLFF
jgi:hypothetical protein